MKRMLVFLAAYFCFISSAIAMGNHSKVDTTGLVAYYPFSGNANDASGHGHDGTVLGAVLTLDRTNNASAAYHFTPSAYIEIPYDLSLYPDTAMTIAAWIKADSWPSLYSSVFSTASSNPDIGYGLRCENGVVRFFFSRSGAWVQVATPTASATIGQWYFVTGTYNGTSVRLYINAILSDTTACTGWISPSSSSARIGSSVNNSDYFNGIIDDIRLYNRALSDQEIMTLYDELMPVPGPIPLSPLNNAYLTTHKVPFMWNAVDSAASYRLQATIDTTFATIEFDHYIATPDTADTAIGLVYNNYYWRVRAYDTLGNSSWWSAISHFTIDSIPPAAPVLRGPANDTVFENLWPYYWWYPSTGAARYHIDVATDSQFTQITDSLTQTGVYHIPYSPSFVGQRYWWRVSACDVAGNWSVDNQVRRFRIRLVIAPLLYVPINHALVNTRTVQLIWSAQDSATNYQIQVSADSTFTAYEVNQFVLAPDTVFTTPPLFYAYYFWRGRAFHNLSDTSRWSSVYRFQIDTIPPTVPVLMTPGNTSCILDSLPLFHWRRVIGAYHYTIHIASDSLCSVLEDTAIVDTTGYRAKVGLIDGCHYWRVRACDTAGNWSTYSAPWSFAIDTYTPALLAPANNAIVYQPRPTFDWSDSRNVAGYCINIATDTLFQSMVDSASVTGSNFTTADSLSDNFYYWRVKAYRGPGDTSGWSERWMMRVATQIQFDSLVAWYPFTGNARDSSGNGHHGTVNGAVLTTDRFGTPNAAYQFNGQNKYILVPYSSALNPTKRITIAAWVNSSSTSCVEFLATEQNDPDKGYGLKAGGGYGEFFSSCAGTWVSANTNYGAVINGLWYFLVGTYDGTAIRLYFNGSLVASSAFSGLLTPSTSNLWIGSKPDGSIIFNGAIDDIRIFQRALTPLEIGVLYHENGYMGISSIQPEVSSIAATRIITVKPNPARVSASIDFLLATPNPVALYIYNVAGQRVVTIDRGSCSAGPHSITWILLDDQGRRVANGVYFIRLLAGSQCMTCKISILR